jgi:hypothetical protein
MYDGITKKLPYDTQKEETDYLIGSGTLIIYLRETNQLNDFFIDTKRFYQIQDSLKSEYYQVVKTE